MFYIYIEFNFWHRRPIQSEDVLLNTPKKCEGICGFWWRFCIELSPRATVTIGVPLCGIPAGTTWTALGLGLRWPQKIGVFDRKTTCKKWDKFGEHTYMHTNRQADIHRDTQTHTHPHTYNLHIHVHLHVHTHTYILITTAFGCSMGFLGKIWGVPLGNRICWRILQLSIHDGTYSFFMDVYHL